MAEEASDNSSKNSESNERPAMSVQQVIENKLQNAFPQAQVLQVLNESKSHNVPRGAETHFKVVVVTANFEGVTRIDRHRRLHALLREELEAGVHALSVLAKTPAQWTRAGRKVSNSPPCMGGSGGAGPSVMER